MFNCVSEKRANIRNRLSILMMISLTPTLFNVYQKFKLTTQKRFKMNKGRMGNKQITDKNKYKKVSQM